MNGHKIGDKISLETDVDGNIINSFWARRLADAAIDNCVEVVLPEVEIGEKSKKGIK